MLYRMTGETEGRWDGARVRRLRGHLQATQAQFAARIGTRQQTVSEWETGASRPRGMSRRLLHLIAEEAGFYGVERSQHSLRDDPDERA
jgi:DNA-binding transcriptional regulator YiaG